MNNGKILDIENILPAEIEKRSFEIITEELGNKILNPMEEPIIKRVIHTTADFEYVDNLIFSKDAVRLALSAIESGADIITDTQKIGRASCRERV